jgi:hypothetical protein
MKHLEIHLQDVAEDVILHLRIVHTDRPSTYLHPVENQVVVLASNLTIQGIQRYEKQSPWRAGPTK